MTPVALWWLRWRLWVMGGAVGILVIAAIQYVRATAVWREQARVAVLRADSTRRDIQRVTADAARARTLSAALQVAVDTLTKTADAAREQAAGAARDARQYRQARDRAIGALRGAQTQDDSLTALLGKSAADDALIDAQSRTLAASRVETVALRAALDSAAMGRRVLLAAVDSLTLQLTRDASVIRQLQQVVRTARPTSPPRFTKLALSLGLGYCATPSLTPRVCAAVVAGPSVRVF